MRKIILAVFVISLFSFAKPSLATIGDHCCAGITSSGGPVVVDPLSGKCIVYDSLVKFAGTDDANTWEDICSRMPGQPRCIDAHNLAFNPMSIRVSDTSCGTDEVCDVTTRKCARSGEGKPISVKPPICAQGLAPFDFTTTNTMCGEYFRYCCKPSDLFIASGVMDKLSITHCDTNDGTAQFQFFLGGLLSRVGFGNAFCDQLLTKLTVKEAKNKCDYPLQLDPTTVNAGNVASLSTMRCIQKDSAWWGSWIIKPNCDVNPNGGPAREGIQTAIGCVPTGSLQDFLTFVLKFAFFASGGVILLMIIATGYTLMTSQGNPEKLQGAKENIIGLFSGLVLIAFSLVLLQAVGADILGLPPFVTP